MKKLILYLIVFAVIIPVFSCSRRSRDKDSSKESFVIQTERSDGLAQTTPAGEAVPQVSSAKKPSIIKVFIENSGSMNGYINTSSEFQSAIQKMAVLLANYYGADRIQLNYVNNAVYNKPVPPGSPISEVVGDMLSLNKFAGSGSGNHGDTNLNDIIRMVLDKTESDCVSILISDFLYSVGSGDQTPVMLAACQNSTMEHFLNKSRQIPSLSTLIIQLSSSFQGKYWDYTSRRHNLCCERPYYMCVIGSAPFISDLNRNIKVDEMAGFREKLLLSAVNLSESKYSVLAAAERQGQFVVRGNNRREIANVQSSRHNDSFQFAVAMDLSDFPLTEAEKNNVSNYCVTEGKYKVIKVEPIDQYAITDPSDRQFIRDNKLTHLVVIRSVGTPIVDCSIQIKMEMPEWVSSYSSTNDQCIDTDVKEQSKTFGIEFFIKGIFDAYSIISNGDNGFLVMNIIINK